LSFRRVQAYLDQLSWYGGVRVYTTATARQTVAMVIGLHDMFQIPPGEHGSLHKLYSEPIPHINLMGRPSLTRRVAKELPHIGWTKSKAVEETFESVKMMVNASEEDWMEMDGVGEKIARDIVRSVS
jgi:ERCC4-type nuclease